MGLGLLVCLLPDEAWVEDHVKEDSPREVPGFSGVLFPRVMCRATGGITCTAQVVLSCTVTGTSWPALAQGLG